MFSGSRNSLDDGADDAGDAARRFDFWDLRDMRLCAFLKTAQTGVRTTAVRTPASGYASGTQAGTMFSAWGPF